MGHALGGVFHVPHGRAVGLFLPYTIEYCVRGDQGSTRYAELAHFLHLPADHEEEGASSLAAAIRWLAQEVKQPLTLPECGITSEMLEAEFDLLLQNALNDTQTMMSSRYPDEADMRRLFLAALDGSRVDF
jgi:alcohol dehydrogenase class IV